MSPEEIFTTIIFVTVSFLAFLLGRRTQSYPVNTNGIVMELVGAKCDDEWCEKGHKKMEGVCPLSRTFIYKGDTIEINDIHGRVFKLERIV